jgi:hypothetical protein
MKLYGILIGFNFLAIQCIGQAFATASGNSVLKEQKYKSYEGELFLFEVFMKADIYDVNNNIIEDVDVNFNRLLSLFTGKTQGKTLLLNEYRYPKIIVYVPDSGKKTFVNKLDSKNPEKYFQVIYESNNLTFLKDYTAKIMDSGGFNYGKSGDTAYVTKDEKYYYLIDGKLNKIKLNEKDILKPFKRQKNKIKKFAKENNYSFKNEDHIKLLLMNFESEI